MTLYECPLCRSRASDLFYRDDRREYFRCHTCRLVFVPPVYYLPLEEEQAEYDLHQNNPADEGYRRFLSRLFLPVNKWLPPGSKGLDFGCGPGPALALMFTEAGHKMAVYDRYYATDSSVLADDYDFITASEVLEHLHGPGRVLDELYACLKPGGILGLMTGLVRDRAAFSKWHYTRDLTHVCFFSQVTFKWLADKWDTEARFIDNRVVLIRKTIGFAHS
jgi:SAM-dependent methyltransferase